MANSYNISMSTPVGQSSSGPIPIRLANWVPICGPMQHRVGQWGTYLCSHATPVGQSIIVPIPIRLPYLQSPTPSHGVLMELPICGPMQHRWWDPILPIRITNHVWHFYNDLGWFTLKDDKGWQKDDALRPFAMSYTILQYSTVLPFTFATLSNLFWRF